MSLGSPTQHFNQLSYLPTWAGKATPGGEDYLEVWWFAQLPKLTVRYIYLVHLSSVCAECAARWL